MAEQESTAYTCDVCGAIFRDQESLAKHQAIHETNDKTKEPLEQGTDKPTMDPSVSSPGATGPPVL